MYTLGNRFSHPHNSGRGQLHLHQPDCQVAYTPVHSKHSFISNIGRGQLRLHQPNCQVVYTCTHVHIGQSFFSPPQQWPWPTTPTPARLSGSVHMYEGDIRLSQTWPWPTTPTQARLSGSVHMYTVDIRLSQTVAMANYTYTSQIVR
jgi:hypothetical protein